MNTKTFGTIMLLVSLLLSVALGAIPPVRAAGAGPAAAPQEPAGTYLLVENAGQYAPEARFLLAQGGQRIWLTGDAIWLTVPDPAASPAQAADAAGRRPLHRDRAGVSRTGTAVRFTFAGAAQAAALEPFGRVATHISYLRGSDPAGWQRDAPVWSGVRYRDLYPGIDLVVGGGAADAGAAAGVVPWRLEARPGADLAAVTLRVEGASAVAAAGQLRLELPGRTFDVALPTWSQAAGAAEAADAAASSVVQQAGGSFVLAPGQAAPAAADSPAGPLDLIYSRFLGGSALDAGYGLAVDFAGNAYITGETASADLPAAPGSYDLGANGATDAFVSKFNAAGTALLYATYLGGALDDLGSKIAVQGALAYVVGETRSANFPLTAGAVGENDIFVASLNATGSSLRYVSLLGGSGFDSGFGIAVDAASAYIVGSTDSADLPGATGCAANGLADMVVARFDSLGSPVYALCFGGGDFDAGYAITARNEVAYVTGESWSTDLFPLTGENDILVAAFLGDGTLSDLALVGGTLGDSGSGIATDIDADGNGSLYIAGITYSNDFPLATGPGPAAGESDAVIVRIAVDTFTADLAAYVGGSGDDEAEGIAVDTVGGLYVSGATASTDFPVTTGAYDTVANGAGDVFVARIRPANAPAHRITYATYLGGAQDDWSYGAATDTNGYAFVAGATASSGFPTTGGPALNTPDDAFIAKLLVSTPLAAPVVVIAASGADASLTWDPVAGAASYQVFRSSLPYFTPGDWSSPATFSEPADPWATDTGALTPVNAYFYIVKAVDSDPEAGASSNRVGKFTFALVAGN